MTIDFETSFYFHREGPGLLMGMSDPDEKPGFSVETSDDWIPGLMEVVRRRAPADRRRRDPRRMGRAVRDDA